MRPWFGLLLLLPATGIAQQAPVVDSGALVRVALDAGLPRVGRLAMAWSAERPALFLCPQNERCRALSDSVVAWIPAERVRRVEVARGDRSLRGAAIGAAIGVTAGFIVAHYLGRIECSDCSGGNDGVAVGVTVPLGGILFGLLGAGIGAGQPIWRPVP